MTEFTRVYDTFARLLSYPKENFGFRISDFGLLFDSPLTELLISNQQSAIRNHLQSFENLVAQLSTEELEELYTRTFDINPIANLEIGWHMYGEQYERGEFLVMMRSLLREHAVEESSELPDHLTHILLALGRMKKEEADAFAMKYVMPSLEKILEAFGETDNPYIHLLHALKNFIEQQHLQGVLVHE